MKPSKELEMPVFSKNLERMDSIQPQNRPPKKKWWILILILCLVLILAGCILYFLLPSRSDTDSSEVASTTSEQEDSDSGIPAGASVNPQNGHSYFVYPDSVSWIDAKTACESLGGHLATMHKNRHLSNSFHKLALNAQISGLAVTTTEIGTSGNGSMERHSPIRTGIPGTMAKQNSASRTTTPEMNGIFVLESPIKPMKLGSNMLDAGMILQTELAMRMTTFR